MFSYIWPIALVIISNIAYQICAKSVPKDIDPFASLIITYLVGAAASAILYYALGSDGNLLSESRKLNWAPIVLGIVTDLLTNNILRTYAETPGANDRWMMFPEKRYITFPLNILYAIVLLLCTDFLYMLINLAIAGVTGGAGGYTLGVGPILFGVFYTAFDLLFISIKRMLQEIVADAKSNAKRRD